MCALGSGMHKCRRQARLEQVPRSDKRIPCVAPCLIGSVWKQSQVCPSTRAASLWRQEARRLRHCKKEATSLWRWEAPQCPAKCRRRKRNSSRCATVASFVDELCTATMGNHFNLVCIASDLWMSFHIMGGVALSIRRCKDRMTRPFASLI